MYINNNNYVDTAEQVIKTLSEKTNPRTGKKEPMVTTSKIRNLLALTTDIYNEVMNQQSEKLSDDLCSRIQYLKLRFVYESGREPKVKDLVLTAKLIDIISDIKDSKKNYILFNRYVEALVAYHKFYGGKEQ